MSESVDTRVVEARFDSKQFEQGVDKTVKKLDELKKSLNLESTGKTIAEIGSKVQDATNKASNSLEQLQNRFTSFTGMLKQKLLSGIADEIVGVFFKIKNSFESLITSLSSNQVGIGMQRYTDMLSSVRTLVSAGVGQDKAYEAIGRLGEYADQTSYSLDSMVATMSKFKTAGADIDTAARMIEGLSNAAASMGVNAQQAERAYLNLQQAYSKKVMLQNDWISFESLPMVGTKFNQAIIDAAVKVGTLEAEKMNADGTVKSYRTKKKAGTKVKSAKGITADNLGSNLASRWFTDEVMEEVFGNTYYFSEVSIKGVNKLKEIERKLKSQIGEEGKDEKWFNTEFQKELDKFYESSDTRKEKIEELTEALDAGKISQKEFDEQLAEFDRTNSLTVFGYECFRAGQEARSFTDVLNTLKDAVSRGWATSFEILFGKLDEASDFFTKLTESNLAEAIYAIGTFRNDILYGWKNHGGRDSLLGALEYIDETFGSIFKTMGLISDEEEVIQNYFNKNFNQDEYDKLKSDKGEEAAEKYKEDIENKAEEYAADYSPLTELADNLGQRLAILSVDIREFFKKVHAWFTEADSNGASRLQRIQSILDSVGSVASGAFTAVGMGLEFVGKVYNTFKTSFDALWKVFDNLASKFAKAFDPKTTKNGIDIYKTFSDLLDNLLAILKPLNKPLTTLIETLGDIVGFFVDSGIDTFLSSVQFFTDAIGLLLEVLGIGSAQQKQERGVLDGLSKSIEDFGTSCKEAFQAVSDFFTSLFDDLRTLLGIGDQVDGEDGGFFTKIQNWFNTNKFVTKVRAWVDQAIKDISSIDFWKKTIKSLFYTEETKYNGSMLETKWVEKPLTTWLLQAIEDIKSFVSDIPNKLKEAGIKIGDFFKSFFYTEETKYNGSMLETKWIPTELGLWFEETVTKVKTWIKSIPSKLKKLPSLIGEFISGLFYKKTVKYNGSMLETKYTETELKKWLDSAIKSVKKFIKELPKHIHNAIKGIGTFVSMIWNALFGNDNDDSKSTSKKLALASKKNPIAEEVQETLDNVVSGISADSILTKISNIVSDVWNGVLTIFTGNSDKEFNDNWLADKVASAINWIGEKAQQVWNSASNFIVNLPSTIVGIFTGKNDKDTAEGGKVSNAISGFAERVGVWVSSIPSTALEFWMNAEEEFGSLWDTIISWITGENVDTAELTEAQQKSIDLAKHYGGGIDAAEILEAQFKHENWRKDNPILANFEDFFEKLKEYLVDKITHFPENVASGLSKGADLLNRILEKATGWIKEDNEKHNIGEVKLDVSVMDENDKEQKSSILESLSSFGQTLWKLITTTIPTFISSGFEWIKINTSSWIDGLKGLFTGGEDTVDEEAETFGKKVKNALESVFRKNDFDPHIYNGLLNAHEFEDAELYKQEHTNPIVEFFKGVVKTIGNLFTDIGPTILNGINTAFKWIGEKLGDATTFLSGLVSKGESIEDVLSEKMVDQDTGEENPLWTAIKEIGQTIWNIITEVIPKFISSAASYIGQQLPKLLSGIFGGGTSVDGKSEAERTLEAIESGTDEYYNVLVKDGKIDEAEQYIQDTKEKVEKELIDKIGGDTGLGLNFGGIFNFSGGGASHDIDSSGNSAFTVIEKVQNYVVDRQEKIDELKSSLDEITKGLANGKYTTEEARKAAESQKKQLEEVISIMEESSDPTFDMSRFIKNNKNSVRRLDYIQSLQNEYNELSGKLAMGTKAYSLVELEQFRERQKEISETIEALNISTGEYYDTSMFSDAETKKAENMFENCSSIGDYIGTMFEGLLNGFEKISNDKLLRTGFIIMGVGILLFSLSKLLDNAMTIDDIGYSAKWVGIGTLLTGITVLIGYMVALAAEGDDITITESANKSKLQRIKEVLDYFKQFLLDIMEPLKWIMGFSMVKEIASMIATFKKDNNKLKIDTEGSWLTEFLDGTIGSGLGSIFKTFFGTIGTTGAIAISADTLSASFSSSMDKIGDGFVAISSSVEEMTSFIGPAIKNLADLGDDIRKAIDAVQQLNPLLEELNKVFKETTDEELDGYFDKGGKSTGVPKEVTKKTPLEQFSEGLYDKIQYFMNVTMIIERLSNSLKTLQGIDNVQEQMNKLTEAVGIDPETGEWPFSKFLVTLQNSFDDAFFMIFTGDLKQYEGYKLSDLSAYFDFLGSVLSIFATNFGNITQDNVKAMTDMLDMINNIAIEVEKTGVSGQSYWSLLFEGNKSLTKFGTQISAFGTSIRNFFNKINEIQFDNDDAYKAYKEKIDLIVSVIQGLRFAMNGVNFNAVSANELTGEFGELFTSLTHNFDPFKDFMTMFNKQGFTSEEINSVAKFFEGINYLINAITISDVGYIRLGLETLTDSEIWDNIKSVLSFASDTYKEFYAGITEDKTSELWKSFAMDIDETSEGIEFKPTITPVLEISDDFRTQAEEMRRLLGITAGENGEWISPNLNINISGIDIPQLATIDGRLAEITDRVNDLRDITSQFNDALSHVGFRISINSKALVNAIGPDMDSYLGQEGYFTLRGLFGR